MSLRFFAQRAFLSLGMGIVALTSPALIQTASAQNFLLEANQFEGKTVTKVEIRYRGAKTVNEARLRSHMAVAPGRKYSQTVLDEDIRTLYSSGLVDDVQFFAENAGSGVKVIAEVVTRPLINGLGFDGNTTFSDKKLANETKLGVGQILSDSQILTARKNIEKLYQGFGFPDVGVSHRLQATERAGYADLIFLVQEGSKNEIRKIRFEGNSGLKDADLRKEMATKEKGWFSWFTKSGRIDTAALDQDLEKIEDFYRSRGYWRAKVGTPQRVGVKNGRVDLVIPITEGPKYTVNSVSFPGIKIFTPAELNPALSLVAGMPFSSEKVRDDIRMIRSYYGSRGYADASPIPDIRDAGGNKVNIFYRITIGKRFKVGDIRIQGNTKSEEKVIRRELPMLPGENFNSVDLETTKRRLKNLNYFNDVQVSNGGTSQSGYRDVNILVNEKQTGSVNFGLGLSSVDNIVGFINLEQQNFNIFNPWNFTGAGQRFSMSLRAGTERKDFRVSLTEPWFLGKKLALGTELYYRDLLYLSDEYDQTNIGGSIFIRKPVGRKAYLKAEYRLEKVEVDPDTDTSQAFKDLGGDFLRSAIAVNYIYDSRDSNVTPRKGHKFDVGMTLAGGVIGGDVETYTFAASGAKHWNLAWDTILTVRGSVNVVDSNKNVPIFERQFLGGQKDLRGFEFRDIGPRDSDTTDPDATDEVLGGNTSAFASLEYTFPIIESVRGAVFYDVGFVNADSWDFGGSNLASDAGFGVRLNLPFGPLAVDYAVPIKTPDNLSDKGGQFNFYLNYQF
ncbi:outer membrane protein assembly factor BamA [Akkermansiaceae bacterium]|nr:outer membrane protein assembly factor BamA [Akkermansiaceae bacterium]MDB4142857.1 outer membrane protein assembly factor BamA [Akkermansiaceae bacterium]MDB4388325.1 outer membrane protein assembly factor BamA [Akkermansiaceae bacterium]MDB4569972.1 outer membrane protein assembly factor BamA [Akkermansiaceae bacterium]